jgi:hypothetical protein
MGKLCHGRKLGKSHQVFLLFRVISSYLQCNTCMHACTCAKVGLIAAVNKPYPSSAWLSPFQASYPSGIVVMANTLCVRSTDTYLPTACTQLGLGKDRVTCHSMVADGAA